MTDAKSAMLELALRAVQQHLERDEYTEAGDVVMQALARVEQVPAPAAPTDQQIVDCLARHGIGWGDEQGVTAYPLDGEDAPVYIGAVRELLAAPADLVRRLLADHQRVEPHHADQCALCREATAAIDGQPAQGERKPMFPESVKQFFDSTAPGVRIPKDPADGDR